MFEKFKYFEFSYKKCAQDFFFKYYGKKLTKELLSDYEPFL